ncbi:hypothetical protein DM992_12255 [Burkholderia sp. JP2-270]|uniref:DUF3564 family protein n=1 Tax=Burkholderia sp. JP2-270 TaxID=2217913 RepID=UPI000DA29E00|nr:DUF3564 family protein [Burkholderia sp. JP2-270]AWV00223.1 hypothetical protein DM992_12255 [Burkholderia sp. JP2-270]
MRITLHLDTFACDTPSAYAILWIDTATRRWSREGHAGMDLPAWGTLVHEGSATLMTGPDNAGTLCWLDDFDLDAPSGLFEGQAGCVRWLRDAGQAPVPGEWHVQWVDETAEMPEHEVFTGDEES